MRTRSRDFQFKREMNETIKFAVSCIVQINKKCLQCKWMREILKWPAAIKRSSTPARIDIIAEVQLNSFEISALFFVFVYVYSMQAICLKNRHPDSVTNVSFRNSNEKRKKKLSIHSLRYCELHWNIYVDLSCFQTKLLNDCLSNYTHNMCWNSVKCISDISKYISGFGNVTATLNLG